MKIIPNSATSYAYMVLEDEDKRQIEHLGKNAVLVEPRWESLRGIRIEISKDDQIPEDVKPLLVDGKFFVIE
jgi:hypothetical protein